MERQDKGTAETPFGPIAFRMSGDGDSLIVCHRFRATMDDWDPLFIDTLAASGRTVIMFDNAGIGESGGVTSAHVPQWADVAFALMDSIGLRRSDVLGWSMGGMVAQWMALKHPTRVSRLVLAGTSPGAIYDVPSDPKVAEIRRHTTNTEEDFLYLFFPHTAQGRAAGRESLKRISNARRTSAVVSAESYAAQLAAAQAFNFGGDSVRPHLNQLTVPTLVANGLDDCMQPPYGSFVIARDALNAKLLMYPHAGHAFLFQHTATFVEEVVRFLCTPGQAYVEPVSERDSYVVAG